MEQDERDLLDRGAEIRLDVLDRVGREVLRVAHDHDLALGEERRAGQLGERAGLELVGRQVAYVGVGVGGTGGRHHLLHRTVQEEVLLAHGERDGASGSSVEFFLVAIAIQHPMPHRQPGLPAAPGARGTRARTGE